MEFLLELLLFGIWYFWNTFLIYYNLECNVVYAGLVFRVRNAPRTMHMKRAPEPCPKPAR